MTPREKAKELVSNYEKILKLDYENYYKYNFEHCRKCALIAVDKILEATPHSPSLPLELMPRFSAMKYWQEVKKEIEKL